MKALPAQSLRIAVADDEPDMREYLERLLPRLGHQVVASARTGNELVTACHREHPDLIITDIRMPDLSGDAAVRRIRETAMVPVILISAYARAEAEGNDLAFCSRLHKPIGRNDLETAIRQLVLQSTSESMSSFGGEDRADDE